MHLQILSSGSRGNCALVRAGNTHLLVDAGLTLRETHERLELARVPPAKIDHLAVTHGHLDHARSAGAFGRRHGTRLHCCAGVMSNASVRGAPRYATLRIGDEQVLPGPGGDDGLRLRPVLLPHDAEPTVAFRLEQEGRVAVILTDLGTPDQALAGALRGAQVLVLEFNHDLDMLQRGPYPPFLKRRIAGARGHLSNEQAASLLPHLATDELHTLVLAHLSETNNTPERAQAAAFAALRAMGREDVRVLVAGQREIGPNLAV
ncbi:MAG: MBL fold metallo-hydrolase [Planctomycetota bacterium]